MADSIFDPDSDLAIDLTSLELDMPERAQTRLLYQFQNSTALRGLVVSLANMEQETYDAVLGILRGYQLSEAVGVQLDVLGRIVGQARILLNAERKQWFGPDNVSEQVGRVDRSTAWAIGAPLFGDLPADDGQYRRLILSKIFKNHVKFSSVPELLQFAVFLTGRNVSFIRTGPMELGISVPSDMSLNDVRTLLTVVDDNTADRKYLTPVAATVSLNLVQYRGRNAFAPDRQSGRPDFAAASLNVDIDIIGGIN